MTLNIKNILNNLGLSYIWDNQFDIFIPFDMIKQRIIDNYLQSWYSEVNNSSRLKSYSIFKHAFDLETYLKILPDGKYKIALTKFRISAHNLMIETGRYENLDQNRRICKSCSMGVLENEFHFLLVCPNYRNLRIKYLAPYFCLWPTIKKFEIIMSSKSKKTILNLSKYIYFADQIRVS